MEKRTQGAEKIVTYHNLDKFDDAKKGVVYIGQT